MSLVVWVIIEHQSGCRLELSHSTNSRHSDNEDLDVEIIPEVTTPPKHASKVAEEVRNVPKTEALPTDFGELAIKPKKAISETVKVKVEEKQKSPPPKYLGNIMSFGDPLENGVKLMVYGSSTNKNKQVEIEEPSFKNPSLLNNAEQEEIDDGSSVFYDSDKGESLEEFWKRAEIKNTQRLRAFNSGKAAVVNLPSLRIPS